MNWHETIEYIRKEPEYSTLVQQAYFEEKLELNVERFRATNEFTETLRIIRELAPLAKDILEIGAGNGVACINFALLGYNVTAVEPDNSDTIGAGAIEKLIRQFRLENVSVHRQYAEEIDFKEKKFDIVYIRQAMHHAFDLKKFVRKSAEAIKPGGLLITIRDHVIYDQPDKEWFLKMHPLHKFYGGENAFTADEYRAAITESGLTILKELKYYDSIINYYPVTDQEIQELMKKREQHVRGELKRKISFLSFLPGMLQLYKLKNGYLKREKYLNEREIPGRMYSYIAQKS
ncbi:MAG TPA: class I SAM-dependent methyltransferase [Puia sp.]|nr:class I SAM-dependent methyltransferase [Puia sp.]